MKTTVNNYIYSHYNEWGMKSFERKVTKLLKSNYIEGHFLCLNAYMLRASGYGSYYRVAVIECDGKSLVLKQHTNDSQAWDSWFEPDQKMRRALFLSVLENRIEQVKDWYVENLES